MNFQDAFNFILTALVGLLTWLGKVMWDDNQHTKVDLAVLREEIANHRVHKDDLKDLSSAIFAKLDRIEDKIDRKADKQ